MTWFVYVDGRPVGTVVAASHDAAVQLALRKFPIWGVMSVEPRERKRKRRR